MFQWKWWQNDAGFLQFLPMIAQLAGSLLGKGAKGAAEGRQAETQNLFAQDALRNQQYGTAQNAQFNQGSLDLQRKNFEENSRGGRAKQALIGNLLSNMQDAHISVPGVSETNLTGGLRPSALGEGGRQAGGELAKQALMKLMAPEQYQGGQILQPPPMSQLPQASGWEKAGGIGGILGILGGGLGSLFGGGQPQQPPQMAGNVNPELIRNVRF